MITIVSGLPRSGTSPMMQMLAAGRMPILSDGERKADANNPRGYLEWERSKQLPQDPACIPEGEGKTVKVISRLLLALPEDHEYRVIFMQRPLPEVLASQEVAPPTLELATSPLPRPLKSTCAKSMPGWTASRTSKLYAFPTTKYYGTRKASRRKSHSSSACP